MGNRPSIVVYFAHLAYERSVINRALCDAVHDLPHVDFRNLLELYPDFYIDTDAEQAVLRRSNLIVFQHPVYWYAAPAIFKHFQDTVLLSGFAYGPGGRALQGKDFLLAVSTGAPQLEYRAGGIHHYPFDELLRPIEQTARFCGMHFLPPLVLHGCFELSAETVTAHAAHYRQLLEDYRPTG